MKNHKSIAKALAGLWGEIYITSYKAVKATRAPIQTLYRHVNGTKSIMEFHIFQQLLLPHEEQALVGWVLWTTAIGHPITYSFLYEIAEQIRKPYIIGENTIEVCPLDQD